MDIQLIFIYFSDESFWLLKFAFAPTPSISPLFLFLFLFLYYIKNILTG
ncbi:MAG: hypothetical protein MRERV_35c021 [Mycoplasmataceae bacterium RV_VA103A]|nr:MAG: hypothetical protein MRERV_35c021 [Mycoplasmataceae bacterium RV_VA103A]